jgi:endo-1,4-beta-xylanase
MKKLSVFFYLAAISSVVGFIGGACASAESAWGGTEEVVYTEDFENGSGDWRNRGSETVKVVEGKSQSGTHSLMVTNRTKTWNGAIHTFSGTLKPGQTYRVSVWLMYEGDSPSQGLNISVQQDVEGQGQTYSTIGADRLPQGEWVNIQAEYTVPRSRYELNLAIYFEGAYKSDDTALTPADLFDFYIDNIVITKLPPAPPPKVEEDIPNLGDIFKDAGVPLGAAISRQYLNTENIHYKLLRHFDAYVFGNEMKQDALEPSEDKFNFEAGDALVEYTRKNNKKMRGHTLVWHQQVPSWLFQGSGDNGLATKEQLYERMERHIKKSVSHFKGNIYTWDVVNEPIEEDGNMRDSRYYQIVKSDEYIANAFRWAREADPDALLCINDYNIEASSAKQDGFYNLVKKLLEEGVPIDVVGLQTHINISWPTVADLRNAIRRFASLGVKVQITEFDMSIYANSGEAKKREDREIRLEQAFKYRALFDMFKEEAKAGNLDMVVVWGISDDDTWLDNHPVPGRTDYPLFFGKDLRAKPAYWILVNPEKLPIQIKKIDATRADSPLVGIDDAAWNLVSPRSIADAKGQDYGWFKVMWDASKLYVLLRADDATKDDSDGVVFFIEPKNQKLEAKSEVAFTKGFSRSDALVEDGSGYTLLAEIPLEGRLDARIGFDIRLKDGGAVHSWNDFDDSQDTASVNYGTVNLRALPAVTYAKRGSVDMEGRRIDMGVWDEVTPVALTLKSQGDTPDGSQFRVQWDDDYVYVLVEVVDAVLNDRSTTVHEQDSVEVFLDQSNGKTTIYEQDDGQYRVNFRNVQSFNGGNSELFRSRSLARAGGYVIESAVPIYAVRPAAGTLFGFDVQINDADANGVRVGIRNWADTSNQGYQDTSGWGVLVLTE